MDIFERIEDDHELQRELQRELLQTEGDSEQRRKLWKRYRAEYDKHAAAEEEAFYAAMLTSVSTADQARHSIAEHQEELELVEELDDTDMSSPHWIATFRKLADKNDHHMEEEESKVFEMLRNEMDQQTIDGMLADFNDRKAREPVD